MFYINIFSASTPLSAYLQTKSLNYQQAWSMIVTLKQQILKKRNDDKIEFLYKKCKEFTKKINNFFESEPEIEVQEDFQNKRLSKKKKLSGQKSSDDVENINPFQRFRIISFAILDKILNSIEERFIPNENILKDCSWLDPKMYEYIEKLEEYPMDILITVTKLSNVNRDSVLLKLKQFASYYFNIIPNKHGIMNDNDGEGDIIDKVMTSDSEDELDSINCNSCWKCIACAFKIVTQLSCHSGMYNNLYQVFKYIMLLPSTQVTCERVFSKLKVIKTKLRSSLDQQHLEPLMLMAIEKDITLNVDKIKLIADIAKSSKEMTRLLI